LSWNFYEVTGFSDTTLAGLTNLQIPVIVILGISDCVDSSERDIWKWYAAANAASYGKEFIQVMMNNLKDNVPDLEGTEKIVPPHMDPRLPPFQIHQYPSHGNAVLLVIPTDNESKRRLLQESFIERAPNDMIVHIVTVPVNSGVGEQPYNEAGIIGAHNRISNALLRLDTVEYEETFKVKRIGTVVVASIENYIQTDNIDRPADYGIVVIHNATTQQTTACTSWGVTVPPAYINRARRFGFEGDPNRGRVTVGQILAAHVPGLDKADWQSVLSGHSRYDLLRDAIRQVPIPW
jgi:non-canonical (house-cleaning) NTP pyrophosphatase